MSSAEARKTERRDEILAAALRVPVIALYIATDPALTGVHGNGIVRNLGGVGAPPSVSEVLKVAEQILRR